MEKTSWAFDHYYQSHGRDEIACTSQGGILRPQNRTEMQAPDCVSFLKQAGPDGMGAVTQTPMPKPIKAEKSLSMGAKAGIGVGIAVAIVIFALATSFLCIRARTRRKARSAAARNVLTEERMGEGSFNDAMVQYGSQRGRVTDQYDVQGVERQLEIPGHQRLELETSQVAELPSPARAQEMSSSPVKRI
jgi:hypothetical protein